MRPRAPFARNLPRASKRTPSTAPTARPTPPSRSPISSRAPRPSAEPRRVLKKKGSLLRAFFVSASASRKTGLKISARAFGFADEGDRIAVAGCIAAAQRRLAVFQPPVDLCAGLDAERGVQNVTVNDGGGGHGDLIAAHGAVHLAADDHFPGADIAADDRFFADDDACGLQIAIHLTFDLDFSVRDEVALDRQIFRQNGGHGVRAGGFALGARIVLAITGKHGSPHSSLSAAAAWSFGVAL